MKKNETSATPHHGENNMMGLMNDMSRKMDTMKMSGDADHDFAEMMVIHHQAAIDMAQQELDSGKDNFLKNLSRRIIEDQSKEINALQEWLKDHKNRK